MDFVTYQFDSSAQFYAELKDLLEEGGFHANPESQVNTFISLIVQYQDEFLDLSGQDLASCCYRLFDSDLFQNNTLGISDAIIDRAIQNQTAEDMWITYHTLYYAGKEFPKVYHWMMKSEFFAKLKYQVLQEEGTRLQPLAASLMYEICRVQTLKPRDLALVDEDFLHYLLDLVERTRTDADEGLNYGAIKLLLTFNEQYMLHQAASRAASNYTPSNPLLAVLADRPGASCTFGENLIFMLNRAEETALQTLILKLLYLFFTSRNRLLTHFFYTNDLLVLIDVIIRELWNLPEEQESLRHAHLRVLGPLLTNTQLRQERPEYKRAEILKVLGELGGGEMDDTLRQLLWEQEMVEQQHQQKELQNRMLTYRDRQSSTVSSPALTNRSVFNATATTTTIISNSTRISDSPCPSPVLSNAKRPSVSSTGSFVLENVLPLSRSNSSTNLHVHMHAPPPPPHSAPAAMRERRDSQPLSRSVSPTTQRLVERVLREWLIQNELKNGSTSSTDSSGPAEDHRIAIPAGQ